MKIASFIIPLSLIVAQAHAAVIYSGLKDFTISNGFDGIYLDVDGGNLVGIDAVGWDVNPFFGGEGIVNSPAFQPVRTSSAIYAPVVNLAPGQTVGPTSVFGSGFNGSSTHLGITAGKFTSGSEGYLGFKLTTNANAGPYYGFMRVIFSNTGSAGKILDWSYQTSGEAITISAVPEISHASLPLICAASMVLRRRRRK